MKTKLLLLAVFPNFFAASAFGATYFLPGVSLEGGWHDAEKEWKGIDNQMCWAAQSANMAQYWQDWYVKAGNTLPEGTPSGYGATKRDDGIPASNIFEIFKENWTNRGGLSKYGLTWYFTGTLHPQYYRSGYDKNANWTKLKTYGQGGYFSEQYNNSPEIFMTNEGFIEHLEYDGGLNIREFTEKMMQYITVDYSVVGLTLDFWLQAGGYYGGHAVTLWGFETNDETGLANAIYITDSDDEYYGIKRYPIETYYDGADIAVGTYLDEELRTAYRTEFDRFATLSVSRFVAAIPEPSAFGLLAGVFAIAVSTARRRRK